MTIYIAYIVFVFVFVWLLNADKIAVKLKKPKRMFLRAANDANIIRDISLGFFINGVFSVLNADTTLALVGYAVLTLVAVIGIINANTKKGNKSGNNT